MKAEEAAHFEPAPLSIDFVPSTIHIRVVPSSTSNTAFAQPSTIGSMLASALTSSVMQCMEIWGGNEPVESAVGVPGLDVWVMSRPCHAAATDDVPSDVAGGGDVHYLSSCATGRIVRLMLADVSGHGPAVSQIAKQLRRLMREHVNHLDQGAFVRKMNERFTELSADGCFATAVVHTFFAPTRRLTLCNAGHPSPLLYRKRLNEWSMLREREMKQRDDRIRNLPLGIEGLTDYEQFSLHMEVGDAVICYSDSLIEAHDAEGKMLGEAGLLALVRSLPIEPFESLIQRLLQQIAALKAGNLADDDVTVLLFRSNGSDSHVPMKRRLIAPMKVIRGSINAIRNKERWPWPEFTLKNLGGSLVNWLSKRGE